MGRSKRKNISPLQKDGGKSRRTVEDEAVAEVEEECRSQSDWNGDMLAELKDFIGSENVRSNKTLTEDIRKCNEERISALENSLGFALVTNETLAKRLIGVEMRAQQAGNDFQSVKRMSEL